MQWLTEKSNQNKPSKWTCIFTGYKTDNSKSSFISTGDQESSITRITGRNIMQRHITETFEKNSSCHKLCWRCCDKNKVLTIQLLQRQHKRVPYSTLARVWWSSPDTCPMLDTCILNNVLLTKGTNDPAWIHAQWRTHNAGQTTEARANKIWWKQHKIDSCTH